MKIDVGQDATLVFEPNGRTERAIIANEGDTEVRLGSPSIQIDTGIPVRQGHPFDLKGLALKERWFAISNAPTTLSVIRLPEAFEKGEL